MSGGAPRAPGASATTTVRVERTERVATLTLDRPPLNVLDLATLAQLDEHLAELATLPAADLQLVVLRGAGPRAFSAGVAVEDHTPDKVPAMLRLFHGALDRLRALPVPTLAVVRGHCLGGGLELAASCDMVLAADTARFGQPEIKLGCFPPVAAALYPRRLGGGAVFDLLLTGRTLDAAEARRLGLVTWCSPDDELDACAAEKVRELTATSGAVGRLVKQAIRAGETRPYGEALAAAERLYLEDLARCEDLDEGLRAFAERRPAEWKHR